MTADLPKERSLIAQIFQITTSSLLIIAAVLTQSNSCGLLHSMLTVVLNFSFIILILFLWEIVTRVGDFLEEINHIRSRYEGNWKNLLSSVFLFNRKTTAFCIIIYVLMLLGMIFNRSYSPDFELLQFMLLNPAAVNACRLVKMHESDLRIILNANHLDYGSGMAYSFFYGYLNLILPKCGVRNEKGIIEKIEDYADEQGLDHSRFPIKKLIILIPTSGFIDTSLERKGGDCEMRFAAHLETKRLDVAGVVDRPYQNSVYEISFPGKQKPLYVAAEGATPLKTLYDVIKNSGTKGDFYKRYKNELIYNFYKTLKDIIKDNPNVQDTCELIYYKDTDDKGNHITAVKVISERIQERRESNKDTCSATLAQDRQYLFSII